jgi:hypothetical protein
MLKRFRRETIIGVHFQCVSSIGIASIQCANFQRKNFDPYQAISAHSNNGSWHLLRVVKYLLHVVYRYRLCTLFDPNAKRCYVGGGFTDTTTRPDTEPASTGVDPNFVVWGHYTLRDSVVNRPAWFPVPGDAPVEEDFRTY